MDTGITKTVTVTSEHHNDDACIFRPLKFNTLAVMKVSKLNAGVVLIFVIPGGN